MKNLKKRNKTSIVYLIILITVLSFRFTWGQYFCDNNGILEVTELKSFYCLSEKTVYFKVLNKSNEDLFIGISVEILDKDGTWIEYCSDIHQHRNFISSMLVFNFTKNSEKLFKWKPKKAGKLYMLEKGKYRFVAYINRKDEVPGRKIVIGEFDLIKCPK